MKKGKLTFLLVLSLLLVSMSTNVYAYPGSGQASNKEFPIQIVDPNSTHDELISPGALVNPLHEAETFSGESATFGGSCLTCHGAEDGANSPDQRYHQQSTYELIRVADGKSMVQEDGTLLFEVDPNGGVVKYKLIVGLSPEAYDGGLGGGYHPSLVDAESDVIRGKDGDFRALAGWHFGLPNGVYMDLPYCMHIMDPNMSKIYEKDPTKVYSDIKIAIDPNSGFEGAKGILQIISGTQAANPHFMKTYGTVVVDYKLVEGLPLEENVVYDSIPKPIAGDSMVFIEHVETDEDAITTMGVGLTDDNSDPTKSMFEPGTLFYGLIIVLIIGLLSFGLFRKNKLS